MLNDLTLVVQGSTHAETALFGGDFRGFAVDLVDQVLVGPTLRRRAMMGRELTERGRREHYEKLHATHDEAEGRTFSGPRAPEE